MPLVYHVFPAYGLVSAADARYVMQIGVATSTAVMISRATSTGLPATALANPLSFPVAIVGTATYVLAAWHHNIDLGPGYLGFVHLPAFAILSVFSVVGVEFAQRVLPKMPDKIHAYTYVGLLIVVVVTMLL
ncbi:MAG: hypothetical protein Q8K93_29470 [Reyranella sp.]|uniref:hypothetical protein n=1 Tax=Reyranella sp. TaxID=1929291 RepID=UPI00272FD640|nr:hypothetical protein [Reyranella sp.]MDP1966319.1 hypothetical protein [Reyranella sp.]MDP2378491.1 hypothetical protein [Reyranella sp.]